MCQHLGNSSAATRTRSSARQELWTDDPAVRPSLEEMAAPMEGLDRFAREGLDGVFKSAAGVPLRYRLFPRYASAVEGGALRPGVIVLPGLMETMAKYGEIIAYLNDRGFSVYTYDHQGQGLSGRLPLPRHADQTVAHIREFQHYVDDLVHFARVVLPGAISPYRDQSEARRRLNPPVSGRSGITPSAGAGTGGAVLDAVGDDDRLTSSPVGRERRGDAGGEKPAEKNAGAELNLSIIGHSMAGLMAVHAALQDPDLFRKVLDAVRCTCGEIGAGG